MKYWPFTVVDKNGKPHVKVQVNDGESKMFQPEEISAMVLTKMKEIAEAYLGKKVSLDYGSFFLIISRDKNIRLTPDGTYMIKFL